MKLTARNMANAPQVADRDLETMRPGSVFSYFRAAFRKRGYYVGPVLDTAHIRGFLFAGQVAHVRGDEDRRANVNQCRFWIFDEHRFSLFECSVAGNNYGLVTQRDALTGAFSLLIRGLPLPWLPRRFRVAWEILPGPALVGGVTVLAMGPIPRPEDDEEYRRRVRPVPDANASQAAPEREIQADAGSPPADGSPADGSAADVDRRTDLEGSDCEDAGGRIARGGETENALS